MVRSWVAVLFVLVLCVACGCSDDDGDDTGGGGDAGGTTTDGGQTADGGDGGTGQGQLPDCDAPPANPQEGDECAFEIECFCGGTIDSTCEYRSGDWSCPADCGDQDQCMCEGDDPGCWQCGFDAPVSEAECRQGEWYCDEGETEEPSQCSDDDYPTCEDYGGEVCCVDGDEEPAICPSPSDPYCPDGSDPVSSCD